ncbi:MAG: DNA polymerase, partial [Limisphaerales bacterium]
MKALLATDPGRFEEYALRDPKVAVRYCLKILALNRELLGVNEIEPTLSSIGINYLLKLWQESDIDKHRVLGTETKVIEEWVPTRGHTIKRRVTVPTADRHLHEPLAIECFHGGRGEQFFFGVSEEGVWIDYDLCGAYSTVLSLIGMPRWNEIRMTKDFAEFQPHVLGYARIKFRFPDNTRFPCLPVRTSSGLIFPLEGETFCCSPEIYLAQTMGAQVEILHGVILPVDFNKRPFESFIIDCTKRRKLFPKKSLEELFWKELLNATYGKTAQGLRKKRVFNTRSSSYQDMPESKITNPFIAAFVTSFIRASVGEILARLPSHVQVSNVTTDGLLCTASEAEALAASQGPICQLFAQARLRLCGNVEVLETKHQVRQVLG